MRNPIRRPTTWICFVLFVIAVVPQSSYGEPSSFPELIVNAGDVTIHRSEDSVKVSVYVENVLEPIGGVDLWLSLGHDEIVRYMADTIMVWDTTLSNCTDSSCTAWLEDSCIAWEFSNCADTLIELDTAQAGAIRLENSAIEDWDQIDVRVVGDQRMMLQLFGIANTGGGGMPIPAGVGQHLLARLVCEVADASGSIPDSMCEEPFYDLYGTTSITIEKRSWFADESGEALIGFVWDSICKDSICIDWDGGDCIEWECTKWDSVYHVDTSKVYFYNGAMTLNCSSCNWIVGDADGSGYIDIDDVVYLIEYIFLSGPIPIPVHNVGNADCSIDVDIDDVVYLISYIFTGGPPPPCGCEDLL